VTAGRGIGFWPAAWALLSALMLKRTGSLWFGTRLGLGLDWGMVFLYGLAMTGTSAHPRGALMSASAHNASSPEVMPACAAAWSCRR
jgi:hypothetical protein